MKCFYTLIDFCYFRFANWEKIMANSMDNMSAIFDASNCLICCKKFITPMHLPCKHSFCHSCLYPFIVNQCKSMESRFGFHCPICRVNIPKTRGTNNPEDWTECFPETQHTFILTATKKCARTAQNNTIKDNQNAIIKYIY